MCGKKYIALCIFPLSSCVILDLSGMRRREFRTHCSRIRISQIAMPAGQGTELSDSGSAS